MPLGKCAEQKPRNVPLTRGLQSLMEICGIGIGAPG
jgi:hypothetical protein